MNKEYKIPVNLFMILEHAAPVIYTTNVLSNNHFVVLIDSTFLKSASLIFKNELNFYKSFLVECSAIDTLNYKKHSKEFELFFKNSRLLIYYILYFYKLKLRLTIVLYSKTTIDSIDLIYKNSNWLERETAEMYNVAYKNKRDSRKLLLDYTLDVNPMLKDYPTEGEFDCYFNVNEGQVILENTSTVEL